MSRLTSPPADSPTPPAGPSEASAPPRTLNTPGAIEPLGDGIDPALPPEPAGPKVGFFRQPWVQNVLPFATSLAFHLALIVIGYATYKTVEKVVSVVKEQIIIPESTLAESGPPGGIPHPGAGSDPTRDAAQDLDKNVPQDSQSWQNRASDNLSQAVMGATGDTENTVIGVGANSSFGSKNGGSGITGSGDSSGSLSPFGVPGGGGGIGPKSNFVGIGGNARKISYFCDASGSMLNVFGQLKVELKKSIDGLKPIQSFNVIFYSDDKVFPLNQTGLVVANPDNKRRAYEFIDNAVATGGTQPIPAIKFALAEKPELMYLLTDGFDNVASFDDVINVFKSGNLDHKMKINCIFLQSDEDPKLVEVLRTIAKDNGGLMKIISKSDF